MPIYFYGHGPKNKYPYFSNFYSAKFLISAKIIGKSEETLVYSAEQAIMWLKALLMEDIKMATTIANDPKPANCKAYGRKVSPFIESRWHEYRDKIAFEVVKAKFEDPELKKLLLATGDEVIAEAAAQDKIWGIGLSVAEATKGTAWRGQNVLGNTLMKVRQYYMVES